MTAQEKLDSIKEYILYRMKCDDELKDFDEFWYKGYGRETREIHNKFILEIIEREI